MDKKQKEALVKSMLEKGESYRSIAQKAKVSPNTIKMLANRAGLDETASISSRAFELFSEEKTPLQVVITLNITAEDAIRYHQEYFMLLGCTEFTKVYLQIKDNPWPYVNLVNLAQNARMGDGEVVELLRIANGHLPRVRLEYDRVMSELNSWKAELSNVVQIYQSFVDRNLTLKKREDELLLSVGELEAKKAELQKITTELQQHLSMLKENNADSTNLNLEVKREDFVSTNDVLIPPQYSEINHPNEIKRSDLPGADV